MIEQFQIWLAEFGLQEGVATPISVIMGFIVVVIIAGIAYFIARDVLARTIRRLFQSRDGKPENILVRNQVFLRLSHLAPGVVLHQMGPRVLSPYPPIAEGVDALSLAYITIVVILFIKSLINSGVDYYNRLSFARDFPITGIVQILKLVIYVIGFIFVASLLLDESPTSLFTAMGALAAGLTFVFKDAILGFVAGIQLTANRMVAVGDWIEMPKYGVDGDVMEIALTTVKIRNFDKTITTIPTYSLISDSFKNWRGMTETGGRRIKRSVFIDIASIKFCDDAMLKKFSRMSLLKDYLDAKEQELAEYNQDRLAEDSPMTDGRRLTNIGSFRTYLVAYLKSHPKVSQRLTLLVRQLRPTAEGLPIELYFFTNITGWTEYEEIQADIFDHIFAAAHEFELRIFQNPTGSDFKELG